MKEILQSEAAECGLACLAMVANHHGAGLDLRELRTRFPQSLKGMALSRMIDIAQGIGLQPRPVRIELRQLPRLRLPCILHWDLQHFVVLERVSNGHARIIDPSFGRRSLALGEVSRHFTGIALELTPAASFRVQPPRPAVPLRRLTGPVAGLGRALALILGLSLALQVFVVLAPFLLQWVVDQVLVTDDRDLLPVLAIGFLILLGLQVLSASIRGLTVIRLSATLGVQWLGNVFSHLIRLPLQFFERRHLGDVVSRMESVTSIQNTLTTSFVEAIVDGLMATLIMVLMFAYSPTLAMLSALAVLVYAAARAAVFRSLRNHSERHLAALARQQSFLLESIRGLQSIKVAGIEGSRVACNGNLLEAAAECEVRVRRIELGFATGNQLLFGAERILVIWVGAKLVLAGGFSVGMLLAYLGFRELFATRAAALVDKVVEFRMLRLHGERLADIVLEPLEPHRLMVSESLPPATLEVELRDVSFRYAETDPWVLENASLAIAEGESVAIVGPSGCGKSTLVKILLGLLPPLNGRVRIGGLDLNKVGPGPFRGLIGAVLQEDQLFAGSLMHNIALSDQVPDLARVERAARRAAIHADIMDMPMGYMTAVGDMGSALSGGQKQRVLLARALYREPRILVLDEATSNLDVSGERAVNEAIRALAITRIIVAHRPETIASADRVVRLHAGRLSEFCAGPASADRDGPGGGFGP